MADKPDVEDSDSEDEEPHVTWVQKYDKPMPQVILGTKIFFVEYLTKALFCVLMIFPPGDHETVRASRMSYLQVRCCP